MLRKVLLGFNAFIAVTLLLSEPSWTQEDTIVQTAIQTVKTQMRIPKDMEIKFVEKKESPLLDFYAVKLMISAPDRDVPVILYVDKLGEKVILGNLIVKGENVTQKEAGQPKPKKVDLGQLDLDKSPFRGSANARVTIVEFSNFQCAYCLKSWTEMQKLLENLAQEVRYVFKHFPLQAQGKSFEISEMVAAAQEVNNDAFWVLHDFLFTREGQTLLNSDKETIRKKIEEMLKEKGFDEKAFLTALDVGKGRKRLTEDLALGNRIRVRGTPTTIVNGELVRNPVTERVLDQYLKKQGTGGGQGPG
jgi:protein-disulfide isomerase